MAFYVIRTFYVVVSYFHFQGLDIGRAKKKSETLIGVTRRLKASLSRCGIVVAVRGTWDKKGKEETFLVSLSSCLQLLVSALLGSVFQRFLHSAVTNPQILGSPVSVDTLGGNLYCALRRGFLRFQDI